MDIWFTTSSGIYMIGYRVIVINGFKVLFITMRTNYIIKENMCGNVVTNSNLICYQHSGIAFLLN